MKKEQVIEILTEMQKWRRSEHPYEEQNSIPYTPKQYGEAIDFALDELLKGDNKSQLP